MPSVEAFDLDEHAVLWRAESYDRHGVLRGLEPQEELRVRWNLGLGSTSDPRSDSQTYDATMFTDRRIDLGSVVWRGRLQDLQGSDFEDEPEGLMEVVRAVEHRDVKGRATRYEFGLMRYKGTAPIQE